ncbi:serine hydrolase [Streptomyces profundus]|uniref:serine hydrolase n=1 Tax=Streptomyces profundus TaxID=2867410 RepID=UPI002ADE4893|nr:serine hydrolase [Streptomyces sp. MA3_2.13]
MNTALAGTLLAFSVSGDAPPLALPGGDTASSARDAAEVGAGPEDSLVEDSLDQRPSDAAPRPVPDQMSNARLAHAMAPLAVEPSARLSVSVLALESGTNATFGAERFDTASIVKVDVLAALLLRAQDEGRELTALERERAEIMIRASDNAATDALWWLIGGASGLAEANERLGLTSTIPGGDGHWGLTQTTSADQIALLRAVYAPDSPLTPSSQRYLQELMATVVDGQRWGVSAAATDEGFELKNGWLPRTETGLWDINSIGRVQVAGEDYLIAVVSDGHATQEAGIAAVEWAAMAAVGALDPADPVTRTT